MINDLMGKSFFSLFLRFSVVERREEEYDHDDLSK